MNDNFSGIPEEKQQKIIDASIEEFARHGYRQASTNNIVKKAGISKGLLFHYFGSKKNLYLYLVDLVMDYYIKRFNEINKTVASDIFERLLNYLMVKLMLCNEDRLRYEFIIKAFMDSPDELKKDIQKRFDKIYAEQVPITFKDMDTTKFRKDVDPNRVMEVIMFCMDGLSNKYIKLYKDKPLVMMDELEKIMDEAKEYLDIIKQGVYDDSYKD